MEGIRNSIPDDCRLVYDLICEMENKVLPYEAFHQIYISQQANNSYVCLVYEMHGKVVGCINLRMEQQLHHAERICEIMELAVEKEYRSQGIGRKLFDMACRYAKDKGCTQIEVCCNQLRTRTHKFYESCGMHNFHYKYSLNFLQPDACMNELGR